MINLGLLMLINGTLWLTKIIGEVACVLGVIAFFATALGYSRWLNLPSGFLNNFLIALFGATLVAAASLFQRRLSQRS